MQYENICLKIFNLQVYTTFVNEYTEHNSIKSITNVPRNNTHQLQFSVYFGIREGRGRKSRMGDLNYICIFLFLEKRFEGSMAKC